MHTFSFLFPFFHYCVRSYILFHLKDWSNFKILKHHSTTCILHSYVMRSNYFIHRILHMTIFNGVFVEKTIVMFYFFSFDMFMNCCLTCSCFTTFHSSQSLKFRSHVFDLAQNLRIMHVQFYLGQIWD